VDEVDLGVDQVQLEFLHDLAELVSLLLVLGLQALEVDEVLVVGFVKVGVGALLCACWFGRRLTWLFLLVGSRGLY